MPVVNPLPSWWYDSDATAYDPKGDVSTRGGVPLLVPAGTASLGATSQRGTTVAEFQALLVKHAAMMQAAAAYDAPAPAKRRSRRRPSRRKRSPSFWSASTLSGSCSFSSVLAAAWGLTG